MRAAALACALAAAACSSSDPIEAPSGAANDAAPFDASGDMARDTAEDAVTDAASDATSDAPSDEASDAGPPLGLPQWLSETGLYDDIATDSVAPEMRAYSPRFPLWSDGAEKRRWLYLPPGKTIDSSDMDGWIYPVGTKAFKEFTIDGKRVETRMLHKFDATRWEMVAYAWNDAQTDAKATPHGIVDALGTAHDIPGKQDCGLCHAGMKDRMLGVSAVQLEGASPGVALADLVAEGRLSDPPPSPLTLPGDATAQLALGTLHANCGSCHNPNSSLSLDLDLWLRTGSLGSVAATPTYTSTVGIAPTIPIAGVTARIAPGDPAASAVHARMAVRGDPLAMPPLASELVDDQGLAAVDSWIGAL